METFTKPEQRGTFKMTASSALRHPMRIRILEVVNERDMSPVQFLHGRLAPKVDKSQKTLSHISYHFRQLAEDGCLEVVERVPRRGATEHVYRSRARGYFSDEEWGQMTLEERRGITRVVYQGLAARVEGAMLADTFDARSDSHLSWDTMDLDEEGWTEMAAALTECFDNIQRIRREAESRLAASGEDGIPTTVGLLGFESPRLPCRDQRSIERPVISSG